MVETIQLLRNVGQFDSVSAGTNLPLGKLALLYAENGRGKTTLATILRSLATGDPVLIGERRRLSAQQPPRLVLKVAGAPFIFQNGAWSANFPDLAIFDDAFVAENVCAGIDIGTEHRQNLHELILGAQGVSLNTALQTHITKIEEHNRNLKAKGEAIPATARGSMTVDAFCSLEAQVDIATAIQAAERNLAAGKSAQAVKDQAVFETIFLPAFVPLPSTNCCGVIWRIWKQPPRHMCRPTWQSSVQGVKSGWAMASPASRQLPPARITRFARSAPKIWAVLADRSLSG